MTGVRLRIIDAFTERPYAGNPAGVVLLEAGGWQAEGWMRSVATELGLSETAFAHPLPERHDADWALRWFTPVVEDDLCGHATLATAHAIATAAGGAGRTVLFSTRSGILPVTIATDGAITLDFPAAPAIEVPVLDGLTSALGTAVADTYSTGFLRDLLWSCPTRRRSARRRRTRPRWLS